MKHAFSTVCFDVCCTIPTQQKIFVSVCTHGRECVCVYARMRAVIGLVSWLAVAVSLQLQY